MLELLRRAVQWGWGQVGENKARRAAAPPRWRPQLEELESRDVPSASGAGIAVPDLHVVPLAGSTSYTNLVVYTPAQIKQAYGFNQIQLPGGQTADGAGQTIAIVDAYDDPNIAADLKKFDDTFGLAAPPSFVKATPQGQPAADAGWAEEIALDVEWAHAIAPKANILLVEAKSSSDADLLAAVDYARNQPGVVVVSMSWGENEFAAETAYDSHFTTPSGHVGGSGLAGGITFVAASGDNGAWYGAEWPAVSPNVLAVGGTTLTLTSQNAYGVEHGWSGSGGGYSKYVTEPSYQRSLQQSGARTSPDVAYDANPNTGFYVYNSYLLTAGQSGWFSYGGTSAGAPQWSALIALVDQGRAALGQGSLANGQAAVYSLPTADFHDVVGGGNGYYAYPGYDLVTGRGTPVANRIVADLLAAASSAAHGGTAPKATTTQAAAHHTDALDAAFLGLGRHYGLFGSL
jgi:subtilase family serine protease